MLAIFLALGVAVAPRLSVDRLALPPDTSLHVYAELPGFDPKAVELRVTEPLEKALGVLARLRAHESRTGAGYAHVALRFESANARDDALLEVRRRVARAVADLPRGMRIPVVALRTHRRPPAAVYAVSADAPNESVKRWVENIFADPLRELPAVTAVEVDGFVRREIVIEPDSRRLAGLGLGFDDLIQALSDDERVLSRAAGPPIVVTSGGAQAIAARAVRLPSGEPIALSEVARVSLVPAEPPLSAADPGLRVTVFPRTAGEARAVAERANAHLAWLRANQLLPPKIVVRPLHDEADALKQWRNRVILHVALAGVGAVATVLLLFGTRAGALVAGAFVVWVPMLLALWWRFGFTLTPSAAAGLILACAPFAVITVFPVSLLGLAFLGGSAGLVFACVHLLQLNTEAFVMIVIGVFVGFLVRWLVTPWMPSFDRSASTVPATGTQPWNATAAAALILAAVTASAYLLPTDSDAGLLRLRVHGPDFDRMKMQVERLLPSLQAIPYLTEVNVSSAPVEIWRLHLDEERMAAHEIEPGKVGRALAMATQGLIAAEVVNAEQRLPLRLRLPAGASGESFDRLLLRGERSGRRAIYLRDVGLAERIVEPRERLRVNGAPAIAVTARWHTGGTRKALRRFCGRIEVPAEYGFDCVVSDMATNAASRGSTE